MATLGLKMIMLKDEITVVMTNIAVVPVLITSIAEKV